MRLTILHVRDCPNVGTLEHRLAEVIAGRDDVDVERRLVDSEEVASERGMAGSPTLLVDGRDPFTEPGRSPSVSCRLYRDESGHLTGAPSVAQLRRALDPTAVPEAPAVAGGKNTSDELSCCIPAEDLRAPVSQLGDWRARAAPRDPAGRAMHLAILKAFAATGGGPAAEELDRIAADHGMTARNILADLHDADVIRLDAAGQIGVAYPFSATPTRHHVRLASGMAVWAMCAIDALGMAAMLDTDALITSSDPTNGQPVTVTVQHGRYLWDPETAVVFLSAAAGDGPSAESCCKDLNFFTTAASAQTWLDAHPQLTGEILEPASAERLGQHIFGSLMQPRPGQGQLGDRVRMMTGDT
jgi:hypothetical protein